MPAFNPMGQWFGLVPQEPLIVAAWGCRAILSGRTPGAQSIDIVPDRHQLWHSEDADPHAFLSWMRTKLSAWLESRCGQAYLDPGDTSQFRLDDGLCHAVASPRGSYGYLYVGAWQDEPEPHEQKAA